MAAGDTFQKIQPSDQLILSAAGDVVGLRNRHGSGQDLRFDPASVAITGGTISGATVAGPNVVYNGAPRLNYRKAMAKVFSGSRARLLVYGDSTTTGAGAGTSGGGNLVGARAKNYCSKLAARLTALGIPAFNESLIGDQNANGVQSYATYDPRLSVTGWAPAGWLNPGKNAWATTTSGAVLSLTPGMTFDTFDILTINNPGFGSFTVNVDGGATLTTVNTAATQAVGKTTVSCARGTHTINLTTTSTSQVLLLGIIPYDSTTGGLDIIQAGWYGGVMADMADSASLWHPAAPTMLSALAPDLALVQLTINDSTASNTPAAYSASLAALDSALVSAGAEVILMSGIPSGNAQATNGELASLLAVLSARAASQSHLYIDLNGRCVDYTTMNAAGWMFDTQHGNAKLYADEGAWLAQTIAAVALQ